VYVILAFSLIGGLSEIEIVIEISAMAFDLEGKVVSRTGLG
jgi:hypothetical protein